MKTKNKVLSEKQFRRYKNLWVKECVDSYLVMSALVLHDKFGFGRKRIQQFLSAMTTLSDDISDRCLTKQDIADTIKAETGINILEELVKCEEDKKSKKGES